MLQVDFTPFEKALRDRAWLSLNSSTAAAAGMTLDELKQLCVGNFQPTAHQRRQLATRLNLWSSAR